MLKRHVTGCYMFYTIISDNEILGFGSKGSLWDPGMLTAEGTVILDSMLETTVSDKRRSCTLLRPNAGTGASACYRLELDISTRATGVVIPAHSKETQDE